MSYCGVCWAEEDKVRGWEEGGRRREEGHCQGLESNRYVLCCNVCVNSYRCVVGRDYVGDLMYNLACKSQGE